MPCSEDVWLFDGSTNGRTVRVALLSSRFRGAISNYAGGLAGAARVLHDLRDGACIADFHLRPFLSHLTARNETMHEVAVTVTRSYSAFRRRAETAQDQLIVSPPLAGGRPWDRAATMLSVAVNWADVLCIPWLRPNGRLASSLLTGMSRLDRPFPELHLFAPFVPTDLSAPLATLGAIIHETDSAAPTCDSLPRYDWPAAEGVLRSTAALTRGREGLVHCVRGAAESSLRELSPSQLDCLVRGEPLPLQTPLDVLLEISRTRRIRASSRAIRQGSQVTCFTARPLPQLGALHSYRRSRRRWQFQPFGIWIAADWLRERGARPVIYGNDECWNQLAPPQRPFFQFQGSAENRWTEEAEWRVVGDVDLRQLSAQDAFFFMPQPVEHAVLRELSPWPVCEIS